MKKLISLSLAVIMMFSMAVSVFAAENENITPLLNRDLKITYNGNFQTFTDVNGNIVYPLSYNDTTYLPVRAVSSLVNLPIAWDGANYTVVLGGDAEVPVPAQYPDGRWRHRQLQLRQSQKWLAWPRFRCDIPVPDHHHPHLLIY